MEDAQEHGRMPQSAEWPGQEMAMAQVLVSTRRAVPALTPESVRTKVLAARMLVSELVEEQLAAWTARSKWWGPGRRSRTRCGGDERR